MLGSELILHDYSHPQSHLNPISSALGGWGSRGRRKSRKWAGGREKTKGGVGSGEVAVNVHYQIEVLCNMANKQQACRGTWMNVIMQYCCDVYIGRRGVKNRWLVSIQQFRDGRMHNSTTTCFFGFSWGGPWQAITIFLLNFVRKMLTRWVRSAHPVPIIELPKSVCMRVCMCVCLLHMRTCWMYVTNGNTHVRMCNRHTFCLSLCPVSSTGCVAKSSYEELDMGGRSLGFFSCTETERECKQAKRLHPGRRKPPILFIDV